MTNAILLPGSKVIEPENRRDISDRHLLQRYVAHRDEAAFNGLVERFGRTVWGVCRRVLRQEQDAEDAFQASFLILARKAASIRKGDSVGSWLYGVAYRISMKARQRAGRRKDCEKQAPERKAEVSPWGAAACRELRHVLDEEVQRLPAKYRAPFVLCCLEGLTKGEAASELRWKEGTVSGRLALARKLLQKRLVRRGVTLSAALTAVALAQNAIEAAAPATLVQATVSGVLLHTSGNAAPGALSPAAVALADSLIRAMKMAGLKTGIVLFLAMALIAAGASLLAFVGGVGGQGREVLSAPEDFVEPPVALGTAIDEQVLNVAFSPDGGRLVTAGGRPNLPGQIQIWHVPTARSLVTIRAIDSVEAMAVSPDGKNIATGDCTGHVKLRDAESGAERSAAEGHEGRVTSVAYSADSAWLVSAGSDQVVKLWETNGLQARKVFQGHADAVSSVAFFQNGQTIVSGSRDKTAIVWDVKTGAQKFVLRGHRTGIEGVAVSPDEKLVATASYQTIKLWDAETGKEIATLPAKNNLVYSVAFSPDNKFLAGAMGDGTIQLWDVKSRERVKILERHAKTVWAVAFSRNGALLASGSADKTAKVWNLADGKEATAFATTSALVKPIVALAYAPDGTVVAMATTDKLVQIRDAKTGDVLRTLSGHGDKVNCLAFSPDGQTLASGSSDKTLKLWDWATGNERLTIKGHAGEVYALAFSHDGKRLASAGQDKSIRLWDAHSGQPAGTLDGHTAPVRALAFSPDGRSLASGGDDQAIKLWDSSRKKEPITLHGHDGGVRALTFSAAGKLASAGKDGTVKLWERPGIVDGVFLMKGHDGEITALAFTPSGRTLLSGGSDKTVRVWDAVTGQSKRVLHGHKDTVTCIAVDPRGQHVVSGSLDTMAMRWSGAKRQVAGAGPEKGKASIPGAPGVTSRAGTFAQLVQPPKRAPVAGLPGQPPPPKINMVDDQFLQLRGRLDAQIVELRGIQGDIVWTTMDNGSQEEKSLAKRGWLAAALLIGMAVTLTAALVVWFFRRLRRPANIPASTSQQLAIPSASERIKPARRRWILAVALLAGLCALGFFWKVVIHPKPEAQPAPLVSALDIDGAVDIVFTTPQPAPAPPARAFIFRQAELLGQEQTLRAQDQELRALNQWNAAQVRFADVTNLTGIASATPDNPADSKKALAKRGWLAAALILGTAIALLAALAMWFSRRARRVAKVPA